MSCIIIILLITIPCFQILRLFILKLFVLPTKVTNDYLKRKDF